MKVWKERLFGERPSRPEVQQAPKSGVIVLGMNRPERLSISGESEQRDFPKGKSPYREIELQREFKRVAVRVQVIAGSNPEGRGNAVFKPVLYVLEDDGSVRDTRMVEPLELDIRPFKPTRLLACVTLDKVRRFAIATPSSATDEYYESRSRDKLKASSRGGFYYATDAVKVRLPYVDSGELVIEVTGLDKKEDGC